MNKLAIRTIDPQSNQEIELVASQMRDTLIEVLGEERGSALYSMDWLIQRVRFHLDPHQSTGEVFVAVEPEGQIVGHTIVRLDKNDTGDPIGLFSTIYVVPEFRRQQVAQRLIGAGERWLVERGMTELHTYTDVGNVKLIRLFEGQGFKVTEERNEFAILVKHLF